MKYLKFIALAGLIVNLAAYGSDPVKTARANLEMARTERDAAAARHHFMAEEALPEAMRKTLQARGTEEFEAWRNAQRATYNDSVEAANELTLADQEYNRALSDFRKLTAPI